MSVCISHILVQERIGYADLAASIQLLKLLRFQYGATIPICLPHARITASACRMLALLHAPWSPRLTAAHANMFHHDDCDVHDPV